jgi:hypothetical protein
LFPELRAILEEAYSTEVVGKEYVVEEYREKSLTERGWRNCNLRSQFERIVKRAGLAPWPRLFHAMRGSRETELAKDYPLHVVTAWLGNTPRIALKHYLMTTDADFERAAKSAAALARNASQVGESPTTAGNDVAVIAGLCDSVPTIAIACNGEDRIRTCGRV